MAMSSDEQEAREQLATCAHALSRIGVYGLAGHVTLRIPNSELILVTPGGGLDKARMTGADMAVIDADGKWVSGPYPPPLEWPIHTAIHRARPELDSVAHLHAHWSTIFAVIDRPMEIVLLPATTLGRNVPWFDHPGLVTTPELGEKLNTAIGDAAAVLMRWHGITVVGDTLAEMFERALFIEENARLLYEANSLGKIVPVPDAAFGNMAGRGGTTSMPRGARTFNYYANLEKPADQQVQEGHSARAPVERATPQ
jgi:ribulose-5-phosphate 4-epimerase/fuculose-1-phosphate aldolase